MKRTVEHKRSKSMLNDIVVDDIVSYHETVDLTMNASTYDYSDLPHV